MLVEEVLGIVPPVVAAAEDLHGLLSLSWVQMEADDDLKKRMKKPTPSRNYK